MKIKNIFGMSLAFLAMTPMVSCTDKNDWEVDSAHDRLFGVKSSALSVDTDDDQPTKIAVNFSAYDKNTEYYIVELSTDSLYDDVPMGGENARIFGEDKSITSAPVDINNLEEYTKYYMRVKAMSSTKAESKWVYYKDGDSFRTPGILHDVLEKDRLDDNIRLTWIPGSNVTTLRYTYKDSEEEIQTEDIALTDADREAGEYKITGLNSNRSYTFSLLNGEKVRGSKTVKTAKGLPSADYIVKLNEDRTVITNEDIEEWANKAFEKMEGASNVSITLGIPAGKTIDLGTSEKAISIPEGVSISFFGRAGEKATLNVKKAVSVAGNHGYISFEHVNIDGQYDADAGTGCDDFLADKAEFNIDSLGITECEVKNFKSSLIRCQGSAGQSFGTIVIDNSILHDVTTKANGFIQLDKGMEKLDSINITNSTIYNCNLTNKAMIAIDKIKVPTTINMESCTFYNIIGTGGYLIDRNKTGQDVTWNCNKVILAKTFDPAKAKGVRGTKNNNISNTYYTTDFLLGGGETKFTSDLTSCEAASSSAFSKPAEGLFYLKNSILEKEKVGDPRWIK